MAARPKSKVAQENLDVFRDAWMNQVRILTDAVDDITTVDDFLAVSENHILEDVNACVAALQVSDFCQFNKFSSLDFFKKKFILFLDGRCGRFG